MRDFIVLFIFLSKFRIFKEFSKDDLTSQFYIEIRDDSFDEFIIFVYGGQPADSPVGNIVEIIKVTIPARK